MRYHFEFIAISDTFSSRKLEHKIYSYLKARSTFHIAIWCKAEESLQAIWVVVAMGGLRDQMFIPESFDGDGWRIFASILRILQS